MTSQAVNKCEIKIQTTVKMFYSFEIAELKICHLLQCVNHRINGIDHDH